MEITKKQIIAEIEKSFNYCDQDNDQLTKDKIASLQNDLDDCFRLCNDYGLNKNYLAVEVSKTNGISFTDEKDFLNSDKGINFTYKNLLEKSYNNDGYHFDKYLKSDGENTIFYSVGYNLDDLKKYRVGCHKLVEIDLLDGDIINDLADIIYNELQEKNLLNVLNDGEGFSDNNDVLNILSETIDGVKAEFEEAEIKLNELKEKAKEIESDIEYFNIEFYY